MSPDIEAQLLAGLNNLNGQMGKVREDVAAVKANQEAHAEMHTVYADTRESTCPTRPYAEKAILDADAIAGSLRKQIVRIDDHETRMLRIEDWQRESEQGEEVEHAVWGERLRPFQWAWENIVKVAAALLAIFLMAQATNIGSIIKSFLVRLFQ